MRPGEITAPIVHATTLITNALIEGKTGRAGARHHRGLRRHAAHPRRAPLRHVRPADRVPRAAGARATGRSSSTSAPRPTARVLDRAVRGRPRRAGRRRCEAAEVEAVASASSTPTSTRPTSGRSPSTCSGELGVPVCISAEVSPQIREYPRMITTACNAATMPVIGPYLDELQKWLAGGGLRRFGADDAVQRRRGVGRRRRPRARSASSSPARRPVRWPASGSPAASARIACCASTWVAPRPSRASSRTASPSSPTRSRWPASTGSRRARASRSRCRRSTWSRSAPAAAAWPGSTSSAC